MGQAEIGVEVGSGGWGWETGCAVCDGDRASSAGGITALASTINRDQIPRAGDIALPLIQRLPTGTRSTITSQNRTRQTPTTTIDTSPINLYRSANRTSRQTATPIQQVWHHTGDTTTSRRTLPTWLHTGNTKIRNLSHICIHKDRALRHACACCVGTVEIFVGGGREARSAVSAGGGALVAGSGARLADVGEIVFEVADGAYG